MRERNGPARLWAWIGSAAAVVAMAAGDEPKTGSAAPPRALKKPVEGVCIDIQPRSNHLLEDDLGDKYPGNNLRSLPVGKGTFGGVRFEVGKAIVPVRGDGRDPLPVRVEGIEVKAKAGSLVFLHGTEFAPEAANGEDAPEVGAYVVRYDDGTEARVPLAYGRDFVDWWAYPGTKAPTLARLGWKGTNPAAEDFGPGITIRVYTTAWVNPHPEKTVAAVDVVSKETACQPFLVAITALPPGVAPPPPEPEPADVVPEPPSFKTAVKAAPAPGGAAVKAAAPDFRGAVALRKDSPDDVVLKKAAAVAATQRPAAPARKVEVRKDAPDRGEILVDIQPRANHLREDELSSGMPGNDLRRVPEGVAAFAGVRFRVGLGVVRVQGALDVPAGGFPKKVEGIEVNAKASRLVFLHATVFAEPEREIGAYVVRYDDGTTARVPIVYGRDVADWWAPATAGPPTAAVVAWDGTNDYLAADNPAGDFVGTRARLYATAWENPQPDKTIAAVDLVSGETQCQPFLVGLTALPPGSDVKPVKTTAAPEK